MRPLIRLLIAGLLLVPASTWATQDRVLLVHEVTYTGDLSESAAKFTVELEVESTAKGDSVAELFRGELAVLAPKLPPGVRIIRDGTDYRLVADRVGRFQVKIELVAKITRKEPWNDISFVGPAAAIASVAAQVTGPGVELHLLKGTLVESAKQGDTAKVRGFLGTGQTVALRWQTRAAAQERPALLTCVTTARAQVNPAVIKYTTELRYEILQGAASRLSIALPAGQTLTRLQGEQIRDWQVAGQTNGQVLTVEFIKPVEASYPLMLFTEQTVSGSPATVTLAPPQPREVERESGTITYAAEDAVIETLTATGLRQINAPAGALAAYQFHARPFELTATLRRIEPEVTAFDRVRVQVEEARLLVTHTVTLTVAKAGVYAASIRPPAGLTVSEVRGEGVTDWRISGGELKIEFGARVLGSRQLEIVCEQGLRALPARITIEALRVVGVKQENAEIGAGSAAGIQLKTAELTGAVEVPASRLANRGNELLAYLSTLPDWKVAMAPERLSARVVAELFNLVTIGDGLVGGSATLRYALLNQGVQELKVRVPAHLKNVEFTGPNIRGRDQQGEIWTITLQDKAWGGYTLVVTYDFQFDPQQAKLPIGGIHAVGVERETGTLAITSAANLQIAEAAKSSGQTPVPAPVAAPAAAPSGGPRAVGAATAVPGVASGRDGARPSGTTGSSGPGATNETAATEVTGALHRIDESELDQADRGLITRPVLLAYRYSGDAYELTLAITRFQEQRVLEAVADRTQLTTVLTENGEMLTQASFMVKNNDKQFQKFTLPAKAEFWACYVGGEPAKATRDGDALLVPLPRGANRDQAVPVDIVYASRIGDLKSGWLHAVDLVAPRTDIQTTYAEWELFVPPTHDLAGFGGNMSIARGTVYGIRDAWRELKRFYRAFLAEPGILFRAVVTLVLLGAGIAALRVRRVLIGAGVVLLAVVIGIWTVGLVLRPMYVLGMADPTSLQSAHPLTWYFAEDRFGERAPARQVRLPTSQAGKEMSGGAAVTSGEHFGDAMTLATPAVPPAGLSGASSMGRSDREGGIGGGGRGREGEWGMFAAPAPVAVAGIRPLRIDLPKTGGRFVFTKVLNVHGDALSIAAWAVKTKTRNVLRAVLQVAGVIVGLILIAWQWRNEKRRTVVLAAGIALVLASLASLLLAHRNLDVAFILVPPVVVLAVIAGLARRFIRRKPVAAPPLPPPVLTPPSDTVGPVVAGLVVALLLGATAQAQTPAPGNFSGRTNQVVASGRDGARPSGAGSGMPSGGPRSVGAENAVPEVASGRDGARPSGAGSGMPSGGPRAVGAENAVPEVASGRDGARPSGAKAEPEAAGDATVSSAIYRGVVRQVTAVDGQRTAEFEAVLELSATAAGQRVRLFGPDVAIREVSGGSRGFFGGDSKVRLERDDTGFRLVVPQAGKVTARVTFLVKVTGTVAQRHLTFDIPPALSGQLELVLDEADATVELPAAVSFQTAKDKDQTKVTAVIGAATKVAVDWTPRVKRAEEIAATVFCQNATVATIGSGVLNLRSVLDYQVTQGELRQIRVRVPAGQRLLRVEGDLIRTWKLAGTDPEQDLVVELIKGVTPAYQLTVETEAPLVADQVGKPLAVVIPRALDVTRETGWVALQSAEELTVTIEKADELQKVDVEEFTRAVAGRAVPAPAPGAALVVKPAAGPVPAMAYRFLKPGFGLAVRVDAVQPQIEAVVRNTVRIGANQLGLSVQADYVIKRAGVFTLRLSLPADYQLVQVAGENIAQWVNKTEAGSSYVEVTLKQRVIGTYALRLELSRWIQSLPPVVTVAGVQPLGAQKLTGYVAVSAEEGVQVKSQTFDGLTEIPPAQMGVAEATTARVGGALLAFKYVQSEPQAQLGWKAEVATEKLASWVRAEVVDWVTVTETLVSGRTLVRYEIQNAPAKEFRVKIPAAYKNVEVTGADIRRKESTNDEWRVELQNRVKGAYTLTVTWDRPASAAGAALELPGIEALGVERETGVVAINAQPPLRVTEQEIGADLVRIDPREVPEWAGRSGGATVLAYRYLRPGYRLGLSAQRFEEAEVLQALVDSAKFATVVADDGQMITEMTLQVRNNGRQYLELTLPGKAEVWSAFVAGQPVRPSRRNGKLLLPLERSVGDAPVAVQVIYVGAEPFPATSGEVKLQTPAFDVPIKSARWELYLPADYGYARFGGTMQPEKVIEVRPQTKAFSLGDYLEYESASKRSQIAEVKSNLGKASGELAQGKLKEATEAYHSVRRNTRDDAVKEDVKKLEKDLRQAQGLNLYRAQQRVMEANAPAQSQPQRPPLRDQDGRGLSQELGQQPQLEDRAGVLVAEQQWDKLQQAQEIAVAVVQPLRVNLPLSGARYAFTQVLQLQTGQALTVNFQAVNEKEMGWPTQVGLAAVGFVVLWVIVAVVGARRRA